MVKEIVRDYKKICPNVDVWVGGPEVSYNVEQVLRENKAIDYVMYGEGELTFKEVMDKYTFNGIGIDDINQAMEPLYTSRPDLERSGMGFTVMETFMDHLEVESEKGIGTKVVIKKKFNVVS